MKTWVKALTILLLAQLVVLVAQQLATDSSADAQSRKLALIDATKVDRVVITDAEGASVGFTRSGDNWQSLDGLPVDEGKLSSLLEKVSELDAGWPVSRSAAGLERFEVADDKFQRRLEIGSAGENMTLYFGTSPGYEQTHARTSGEDVFAVKLSNFELSTAGDDWLDPTLLQPKQPIAQVTIEPTAATDSATRRLIRDGARWQINDQPASDSAVQSLVTALENMAVLGHIESTDPQPQVQQTIRLLDAEGEWQLEMYAGTDDTTGYVISSRYPGERFRVAEQLFDTLNPSLSTLQVAPADGRKDQDAVFEPEGPTQRTDSSPAAAPLRDLSSDSSH